jgi:uncharacterized protein (TIGR00369 family)
MSSSSEADQAVAERTEMFRRFVDVVPHNGALGIRLLDVSGNDVQLVLPYDPRLVGNPDTGVIHGGAVTTLMDTCCGTAVLASLPAPGPLATLDLRIDYLKPAVPGRDVIARATCYKLTRTIAFVRCAAYHADETDWIASGAATFMLSPRRPARRASERPK